MGLQDLGASPWHLTRPTPPPSQHSMLLSMRAPFFSAVSSGTKRPPVFPYQALPWFLLVGFFMVDHRNSKLLYQLRWPLWIFIVCFEYDNIQHTTSLEPAMAFMVGILAAWSVLWSTVCLIFTRPQFTARRVERRRKKLKTEAENEVAGKEKGRRRTLIASDAGQTGKWAELNGKQKEKQSYVHDDEWEYFWQPYPTPLLTRLSWVLDLIFSFRGQGWNFSIPSNPALPPSIAASLGEAISSHQQNMRSKVGIKRFRTRKELARYQIPKFIGCYLILDAVKLHTLYDPVFRTADFSYPPPAYLAGLPPFLLMQVRKMIVLLDIVTSLEFIELFSPIVLCLILGPAVLGVRGEAWMYPTDWGSLSNVFSRGLGGLWGGWWHQIFRTGFSAPTDYLVGHGWLSRSSFACQNTGLVIAFSLSGVLHLCGSMTQLPQTNPLGPLSFFLAQGLGIFLQILFCTATSKWIKELPGWTRHVGNALLSWTWLCITGPPFVDDMARGAIWLFEPLPLSPLRALGFGPEGEGYGGWTWGHLSVRWWSAEKWWESGVALF